MGEIATPQNQSECKSVPLKALRTKTRSLISNMLNPPKAIPTDSGYLRDWNGLAELTGFSGVLLPHIQSEGDKTARILDLWYERDGDKATVQQLLNFLEELDRFDIIYDISDLVDEDIKCYKNKPKVLQPKPIDLSADCGILTVDDVANVRNGLPLQTYDAFVLFDDADIEDATKLIGTLENDYKLKLCVTVRDLIGGTLEFDATTKLIRERCNRLIVIVSPSFSNSFANKFFLNFAHSVGIALVQQRKVIPCTFQRCTIPPELSPYHILEYQRIKLFHNFYEKLRDAIVDKLQNSINGTSSSYQTPNGNAIQQNNPSKVDRLSNTLGLSKNNVKFESDTNLYKDDKDSIIPAPIVASTSSENLDQKKSKKTKTKKPLNLSSSIMNKFKKLSMKKHMKEAI